MSRAIRWGALVLATSCSGGPRLVSAPMLDSAPAWASAEQDAGAPVVATSGIFAGVWEGRAWEPAERTNVAMSVTFEPAHGTEMVAHVVYVELRCRADWRLHQLEARRWAGEEAVTNDPLKHCVNHGNVTLEANEEDTLTWRRVHHGETASATLERTTQPD